MLDRRVVGNLAELVLLGVDDELSAQRGDVLHDDRGFEHDCAVGLGDVGQERSHSGSLAFSPLVHADQLNLHVDIAIRNAELGGLTARPDRHKVRERASAHRPWCCA